MMMPDEIDEDVVAVTVAETPVPTELRPETIAMLESGGAELLARLLAYEKTFGETLIDRLGDIARRVFGG